MIGILGTFLAIPSKIIGGIGSGWTLLQNLWIQLRDGVVWSNRELRYWGQLFLYSSRKFLRVESYLSLLGAIAFFGTVLLRDTAINPQTLLDYCYMYFTVIMVLFSMNLLPREKEEGTLEILWSQPLGRGKLIVVQLLTLTTWCAVLCLIIQILFSRFSAYSDISKLIFFFVVINAFTVGTFTVVISTFCRHAIATGLVALLVMGIHLFWLRELGPIMVFYNPIPAPGAREKITDFMFTIIFNRIVVITLFGFALDYLFRRLKRTAEWFT